MSLKASVQGILTDLNDLDSSGQSTTFTESQILRYMNEGRCLIESLNPSFYASVVIFKLDTGSKQQFKDCTQVLGVIGQADCETCDITSELPKCDSDPSDRWNQCWQKCETKCCNDSDTGFKLDCYKLLTGSGGIVLVEPPVPEGVDVCLAVNCMPKSKELTIEDSPSTCQDLPAITQWALYRASMVDAEDPSSFSAAQIYMRTFADLSSVQLTALKEAIDNGDKTYTGK